MCPINRYPKDDEYLYLRFPEVSSRRRQALRAPKSRRTPAANFIQDHPQVTLGGQLHAPWSSPLSAENPHGTHVEERRKGACRRPTAAPSPAELTREREGVLYMNSAKVSEHHPDEVAPGARTSIVGELTSFRLQD